jgi:hypothetical protein
MALTLGKESCYFPYCPNTGGLKKDNMEKEKIEIKEVIIADVKEAAAGEELTKAEEEKVAGGGLGYGYTGFSGS